MTNQPPGSSDPPRRRPLAEVLLHQAQDALALVLADGRMSSANQEWCLLSGLDQADHVGRSFEDAMASEGDELIDFVRSALADDTPGRRQLRHRHRHGFEIELLAEAIPVSLPGGAAACLIRLRPRGWTGT